MKILDIALKDLTRSFRSLFAIGMMVGAPLLITGLLYLAFGGAGNGNADLPAVTVGVVNADTLPAGAPLTAPLGQSIHDMFHDPSVQRWLTASDYPDEAAARAAVNSQQIGVAVVIPAAFTQNFLAGSSQTPIVIIQDPTLSVGPLVARNMVTALLDGVAGGGISVATIVQRQQANGLASDPSQITSIIQAYQDWYVNFQRTLFHNPDAAALKTVAPAQGVQGSNPMQQVLGLIMAGQMIFFAFYTGAYAMMSVLREEEEGTLARIFTTPTSRTAILAGKFLAVFLTVILQGLFLMLFAQLAFGVDWGQTASVALVVIGQVVAAAGLGVLLIALTKNSRQAGPVLGGGLTALGMLGGVFTAGVPNMPAALQTIATFTPHGWVMQGWKLAMAGQPPSAVLLPFAVSLAMGLVMFVAGAALFRQRLA